jgi:hypothetical protein
MYNVLFLFIQDLPLLCKDNLDKNVAFVYVVVNEALEECKLWR